MTGRTVTVSVGWLVFTVVMVLVGFVILISRRPVPPAGIDPARVRAVCEQYAGLDLSGLAPLCIDAGYTGERVYLHPEDLDR
jgi:hypothetical protein